MLYSKRIWCLFIDVCLNASSNLIDSGASILHGLNSYFPRPTTFGRPLVEAFQILANVFDWVQIKSTIRAENCLIKISRRVVRKVVCQTLTAIVVRPSLSDIYVPDIEDSSEPFFELCHSAPSCIGHHTRSLWKIENVVIQPSLNSVSNLISKIFIPSMMIRARRITV